VMTALTITLVAAGAWVILTQSTGPSAAPAPAEQAAPAAPQVQLAAADTPAADVARAMLMDRQVTWAALPPVPFGCRTPDFVLSATAPTEVGSLGVHVTATGAGRAALDQLAACGRTRSVGDAPAVRLSFTGGSAVVWQRGDVLISLAAASVDENVLVALDQQALGALAPVCAATVVTAADATRNPRHPQYAAFTQSREVAITPSPADPGGQNAQTVLAQLDTRAMPAGIAGPPLPAEVARPDAPAWPGPQESVRTITVPALDVDGPGCGWAFTGAVAPVVDGAQVEREATALVNETTTELRAAQLEWNGAVADYLDASAVYEPLAAAWNAYTAQVASVQGEWVTQRLALDAHEQAVRDYEQAVRQRQDLIDAQALAQGEYDEAVAACQAQVEQVSSALPIIPDPVPAPSETPTPAPSGTTAPTPAPTKDPAPDPTTAPPAPLLDCPAPRPAVLNTPVPAEQVAPTAPVLWSAQG